MILRSQTCRLAAAAFILLPALVAGKFQNDFSNYPDDAQPCLNEADEKSGCNADAVAEMNKCLCGDGGSFLTNSAKCIGEKTSQNLTTLQTTFKVLQINCDNSKTPMKINLADFLDLADPGDKPAYSGTSTDKDDAPKPTNTNKTDGEDKGGLPMGAIIGIAVGAGVIVLGAIAAAIIMIRKRKKRNLEESHPMLVSQSYNPGAFPPAQNEHASGMYHSPNDVKAETSHQSSPAPNRLSPHQQQQGWNNDPRHVSWNSQQSSLGHQSWTGATQPYQALGNEPPQQPPQQFGPPVFELPNNPSPQQPQQAHRPHPIEMPATPLDHRQQQQQGYGYGQGRY
jgi:hypothetical protein